MKKLKKAIRNSRMLNMLPRLVQSTAYYNFRYAQIAGWLFKSKEDTNFTYELTNGNLLTLAQTIAVEVNKPFDEVVGYINEASSNKELANHIRTATLQSALNAHDDEEVRLHKRAGWYAFVRALKPAMVVETGVDKGLGAVTLCAALLRNKAEGYEGKYIGTDINPKASYLLTGKYAATGQILYGDSIESHKKIKSPIDLFINDSDHSADYEWQEYMTIIPKLSKSAVVLGDNSHVTDKLIVFSIQQVRKYLFFKEVPLNHWYPGGGIGISF